MKVKVNDIKIPRCFPYREYSYRVDGHNFHAMLGEDGEGKLIAGIDKKEPIYSYEDTLEHWMLEAQEMSDFYNNLVGFLMDVKYHQKNKKKK